MSSFQQTIELLYSNPKTLVNMLGETLLLRKSARKSIAIYVIHSAPGTTQFQLSKWCHRQKS